MVPATRLLLLAALSGALAACDSSRSVLGQDAAAAADLWAAMDYLPGPDRRPGDLAAPLSCSQLLAYDQGKRVAAFQTRQAVIHPSLGHAWLVRARYHGRGELYLLEIPTGKLTQRATGVSLVQPLGTGGDLLLLSRPDPSARAYNLSVLAAGAGKMRPLVSAVCGHRVTADGGRVFAVNQCKDGVGTLRQIEVASGKATVLDSKVAAYDPGMVGMGSLEADLLSYLALDQSGTVLAYVVVAPKPGLCPGLSGQLRIRHLGSGTLGKMESAVAAASLEFLPAGGGLLYRQVTQCSPPRHRLLLGRMSMSKPITLIEQYATSFSGIWDLLWHDQVHAVRPDGKRVLVADASPIFASPAKLRSVRVDGKGGQVLVSDMIPSSLITQHVERPFRYSSDGKHVVYLARNPKATGGDIATVPAGGGKRRVLASGIDSLRYVLSRGGAWVAFSEHRLAGLVTTRAVDLNAGGPGAELMRTTNTPHLVAWIPGDRGALILDYPAAHDYRLIYAPRAGGKAATPIGQWKDMQYVSRWPYAVDSVGCLVLYNQDRSGQPGTYLRRLPR